MKKCVMKSDVMMMIDFFIVEICGWFQVLPFAEYFFDNVADSQMCVCVLFGTISGSWSSITVSNCMQYSSNMRWRWLGLLVLFGSYVLLNIDGDETQASRMFLVRTERTIFAFVYNCRPCTVWICKLYEQYKQHENTGILFFWKYFIVYVCSEFRRLFHSTM